MAVKRTPVPASIAGRVTTLLLIALAWAAANAAADAPELRDLATTGWFALVAGTIVAGVTPVSRAFRRISAWPVAILLAGAMAYLTYESGTYDRSSFVTIWYVAAFVLGLDLRWVSRLRVWVIVSGICLIPSLVLPGRGPVLWAGAWLGGAFVTLWILSADVHRAAARPADAEDVPARVRRPFDLARIGLAGLSLGLVFGVAMDSPGFSFRPLERVVRYLPFRPDLDLADIDIRDYEIDDAGFEVSYRVTPDGQRFVLDPNSNEPFAVVERDGVDEFRSFTEEVVATIPDGASTLVVPLDDGTATTYQRDDRGWFVPIDGVRYRAELRGGAAVLVDPTGAFVDAPSVGLALPPAAVLDGTVGEGTQVWRYGSTVEVDAWRRGRRSYRAYTDELEVDVRRRGDRYEYRWSADRSSVRIYVDELRQSGTLEMDRGGNAFDYLRAELARRQPTAADDEPSPWPGRLRRLALVVLAAGALATIAVVGWRARRRAATVDRTWAEARFARIEAFGSARTEPRGPAESVVTYLDRLAREVDADDRRLRVVGEVLDDALYGAEPLTPADRERVDLILDEVILGLRDDRELTPTGRRRGVDTAGRSTPRPSR